MFCHYSQRRVAFAQVHPDDYNRRTRYYNLNDIAEQSDGEESAGGAMKLYLMRHGQANWENWDRPDDERPLTKKGRKEVERVAEALRELKVRPQTVLTSPLPRAAETAAIVSAELEVECVTSPLLAPGFGLHTLRQVMGEYADQDLMLVGHEPDLSLLLAQLTGGTVRMAKAGLARVDLETAADLRGELVWLIPPKVSKEI
jgi:phosphohistidine phosphatase